MKKTCIIIDDAGFIRELIKSIAIEQNFQILAETSNGEDALRIFKVYSPDVLFLDLVLPDVNGIELLKQAQLHFPKAKIVICSSVEDQKIKTEVLNIGVYKFLQKPFTKQEIVEIFQEEN